ncbi:hypothetical protein [Streptomyces lavendofoliae]|uniref:Uncharacterized protein n=1 Tax=Streptomyces lavendofoliae TaxID=67314 RepID=A0A918HTL1_9ACTN|nr:hypothetical protein [Streptomyces lavendofoliae]GGU20700.1 hypothetical protein GCM10010274_04090 [Streptomyces lavendofoliae]
METTVLTVIGTLLGAVVTHLSQGRAVQRAAALTGAEQLRRERISTYSAFADAVDEYRRARNARWYRRNGGRAFEVTHRMHEARDEAERERRPEADVAALASFTEAAAPGVR